MRLVELVLFLSFLGAGESTAQHRRGRHGLWWSIGLGYGAWHFSADSAARRTGSDGIGVLSIAAGMAVSRRTTLGLEVEGGSIGRTGASASGVSLLVAYYPWPRRGAFVRGGLGSSSYRESSGAQSQAYSGTGFGYLAGVGWDLPVSKRVSLTPMLGYRAGTPGSVGLGVPGLELATGFHKRAIILSLGLTVP